MLKSPLLQAVHAAADELRHFMNIEYQITSKEGINNLVTEADHTAEKAILENFPDHHILSEEVREIVQDSNYKWATDHIDGTLNFAHRIPLRYISIGVEHDKEAEELLQIIVAGINSARTIRTFNI